MTKPSSTTGAVYNYTYEDFERAHQSQLLAADVPKELWATVFAKLANEVFDAGDYMSLVFEEDEDSHHPWRVLTSQAIDREKDVFIVDHAWTFEMNSQVKLLLQDEGLRKRMMDMVGIRDAEKEESSDEEVQGDVDKEEEEKRKRERRESRSSEEKLNTVEEIVNRLWKYVGTYTLRYQKENGSLDSRTMWYVMDELGSRIAHSRSPNARLVPLFFAPHGIAYSLLFFLRNLSEEVDIVRDCTESLVSLQHPEWVDILELPWTTRDFSSLSSIRLFPDEAFFLGGRMSDKLASLSDQSKCAFSPHSPLRIFADDVQLIEKLRIPFELVDEMKDADVVWLYKHFNDYEGLCKENASALVNQFPCESCLTTKDLLSAILCRDSTPPPYFQMTYNLNTELAQFAAEFHRREKSGEDNTWIIKPWNMARGLDMHVTDSLHKIVRLLEAGPKIACKYIENPVTFQRPDTKKNVCTVTLMPSKVVPQVKFDLRFIVYVVSVRPLVAYIYNNYWIRFAINEFVLDRFHDEETHFTVFNYSDASKILQMAWPEFVEVLEKNHPKLKWKETKEKINSAIRDLLERATKEEAPRGVASNVQSRAMYGIDVMLQWDNEDHSSACPSILEVNFMPDCTRACSYYQDFADTTFNTLFLDKIDNNHVTKL